MKGLFPISVFLIAFVLTPALLNAQTTAGPPLSQPLVREGALAVTLAEVLKMGTPSDEIEAESLLGTAGISPRNGWIADYPVTPDIVGELQASISDAADAGIIAMGADEAVRAFQGVMTDYTLNVTADTSGQETEDTAGPDYPDSGVINDTYNTDTGPPVVTYYAPPPDYAYLYTWVPYPFWWWNVRFPGFFVLADFDKRGRGHGHERGRGENISNHFRDPGTGRTIRIDPANRPYVRGLAGRKGTVSSAPPAQGGGGNVISVRPFVNTVAPVNRGRTGALPAKEFRGYAEPRPSVPPSGTRSSAFDHSVNIQSERAASDRGFQSRSSAGQVNDRAGGGVPSGGLSGGFHGGGRR